LVCLVYLVCFVYLDCLVGEKQREKSGTNGGFISFIWFVLLAGSQLTKGTRQTKQTR